MNLEITHKFKLNQYKFKNCDQIYLIDFISYLFICNVFNIIS